MTRYTSLKQLNNSLSPDVADESAAALAALRAEMAQEAAAYLQPARTAERAALDNAGSLGGAQVEAPSEHDEQCALFAWAAANEAAHPELCCMFAIPNGGHRHPAVAAQLKAEGVRAGVPDICLPIARGRFHSLWIEMKRKPNTTTDAQRQWLDTLHQQGHCAVVCWSAAEAQQTIMAYLGQEG